MPNTDTVDPTTLDWTNDPTVVLRNADDEIVGWPEDGGEPDWDTHHIYLADGFSDPDAEENNAWVVSRNERGNWVVDSADGESFMSDPGDRYNRRHQLWDTWQAALFENFGEPNELVDEGDGFYRLSFGPDQKTGEPIDLVVQPRPGGQFCAFLENEDEPRRYLADDPMVAVEAWLGLNDIQPS